jgi:sulfur-oxidizing protein SoxY
MSVDPAPSRQSRRHFLMHSGHLATGAVVVTLVPRRGRASPQAVQELVRDIVGEATIRTGRVRLDIPALVENGNVVPLTVAVESPMTEADHVKKIHVINEKNPQPHVISVTLGPRAGRASLSTRIKLADSQQVLAVAEMSDGSFWTGATDVIVTLAACVEDLK